ncbi:MAG TPA: GNAT family N-acetyltransferase [Anaeromyxobacter sp.]|nr:GNAT family N-acetyltransferase [Anaeromyxobacter sp.]
MAGLIDAHEDATSARVHPLGARDPIHGAIFPADVRPGDPIIARVRTAGAPGEGAPAPVWRISPLGVEFVRTAALAAASPGDAVDVTLRVGKSESRFEGLRVVATRGDRGRELVALRWSDACDSDERAPAGERRDAARWSCGHEYLPTGVAANSVRFDEHLHFRILDISRTGMRLVTSLRNKYLIPGVRLEATCAFPTVGEVKISFRVVRAHVTVEDGNKYLAVGATWSVRDRRVRDRVAQYLLRFGPGTTLRALRADAFEPSTASDAFEYGYVRTDDDYRDVLALRRLAYVAAGKVGPDARNEDMADAFDERSRILIARHQGKIVGTMRLMFPATATDPLKHAEYLTLPASMPPLVQLVEISKASTHPDYRGGDLFYSMTVRAAVTTVQAGRRYLFMSSTQPLVPIYRKLGVRKMGASYVHPTMHLEHHLLLGDAPRIMMGQGMNPIFWNAVKGRDVWDYACLCGIVEQTLAHRARVLVWRMFAPLGFVASRYLRSLRARSRRA